MNIRNAFSIFAVFSVMVTQAAHAFRNSFWYGSLRTPTSDIRNDFSRERSHGSSMFHNQPQSLVANSNNYGWSGNFEKLEEKNVGPDDYGSVRSGQRPAGFDPRRHARPLQDDDDEWFIFDQTTPERSVFNSLRRRTNPTTPRPSSAQTVAIPGMGTTRTPCEDACQITPQYDPICGNDNMTYFNRARMTCAQRCGKRVRINHVGACRLNTG